MKRLIYRLLSLNIGTKLTITFIFLIFITSVPLSYVVINLSERIFYENTVKSLKDNIISEEFQLRYYMINRDYWSLFKFVKGLAQKNSVSEAAVIDGKGRVLAHSDPQRYPIGSEYSGKGDISYPIVGLGSEVGSVVLLLNRESIWAEFKPIRLFLMFSALPFALISLLLGVLISYRIRSRLSRIEKSIEVAKKGNLAELERVEFLEKDELQDFADFLFETIKALRNYYENIDFAQRFYGNLLNTINELVFVTDRDGKVFYVNDKVRDIGYRMEELIGRSIESIVEYPKEFVQEKESKYREVRVKGRDRAIPALMGVAHYEDWNIVTLVDISDRKVLEEKLKRMELFSTLGEMSANLAHELKNAMLPLNLLSSVDKLSEEDLFVIRNSLSRMTRLVNMFLNFAKPSSVERTKFKLSLVVDEVLSLTETKVKEKNVRIVKKVEDVEVASSRDLIEIILINLLSNAIDAVEERGEVGIQVFLEGGILNIEVWDTGKGIPEEEKEKVFEPFYTTKEGGSGLGLSIVLRNVYLLKGTLELNSEPGKGSIFKIKIPVQGAEHGKYPPY
ncbi:PAS domain S-box-containing protein [Hydrogenivirga caldilitoris]|uniref:histidine kinase n=1 Tax=Hydrogenivirga caldilitoris TaxID=246264 RepID=A0A497XNU9_9AQUI|nr:ATP-binding protein [Hydrogenivirga caldilitoris]RLJ70548.1 PAS domain S-box-containing protein [Hydrogenivirga caldilitoris]